MKRNLTLLVLAGVLPTSAYAMESATVGSQAAQATVTVLNSKIDTFAAQLQAVNTQLQAVNTCNALGKFYGPGHSGADASGCWSNSAIPSGTIAAFAATSCPTGWSEYTPARGAFLRGIDNGAGRDPDGTPEENYSIAIPPPNVTGVLHMGHALNNSVQDCLVRSPGGFHPG